MAENAKMTVVVALIGAAGAIGAALIPVLLADRTPPAAPPPGEGPPRPAAIAPPATAAPIPVPVPAVEVAKTKSAAVTKGGGPGATLKAAIMADHAHLQGRWRVIGIQGRNKEAGRDALAESQPTWTFNGDDLTLRHMDNGKLVVQNEGTFKLRPGRGGPKHLDFAGAAPDGRKVEFYGIYEFEGDALKICFKVRRNMDDPVPDRPDEFGGGPNGGINLRLRKAPN